MKRIGYGQVEPNHLANQSTKQSYGQLPAKKEIAILENGQFVKYDYAKHEVNLTGLGEWMLVWNEIKLYDGWRDTTKDFALIADNYIPGGYKAWNGTIMQNDTFTVDDTTRFTVEESLSRYGMNPDGWQMDGRMYPRVIKTEVGDIITTNCFAVTAGTTGRRAEVTMADLNEEDILTVNANGYLEKLGDKTTDISGEDFVWQVAKVYTMPDGQPGVKIQRIK